MVLSRIIKSRHRVVRHFGSRRIVIWHQNECM
jgi:hypothetical protein